MSEPSGTQAGPMSQLMEEINPLIEQAIEQVGASVVVEFFIHTAGMIANLYEDEIADEVKAAVAAGKEEE